MVRTSLERAKPSPCNKGYRVKSKAGFMAPSIFEGGRPKHFLQTHQMVYWMSIKLGDKLEFDFQHIFDVWKFEIWRYWIYYNCAEFHCWQKCSLILSLYFYQDRQRFPRPLVNQQFYWTLRVLWMAFMPQPVSGEIFWCGGRESLQTYGSCS